MRRLSLAAYLLFNRGTWKSETAVAENLPPYMDVYTSSLGNDEDRDHATDALRKQLARDVEALSGAGITVEVSGDVEGRRYRLRPSGFSPVALDLTGEERAVLAGALRELRRDFPYAGPLQLAVANLIGAASAKAGDTNGAPNGEDDAAFAAAIVTSQDEEVSRKVGALESAVTRRKRVSFDYYSISRDETSSREVEPYVLSLIDGTWYVTGHDTKRKDVRQFRLSRIRGKIIFATKDGAGDFEPPEDLERRFGGPRAPWQLGTPEEIAKIILSPEALAAMSRRYPSAVVPEGSDQNGYEIISTPYSGERQLAGYVLTLGEEAYAVSPPALVGRISRGLERIARAHAPAGEHP